MIHKKPLLFAPCAFNLAETSRMVEIAKGVAQNAAASQAFEIHLISDGGAFESLIEKHGFALTPMDPVAPLSAPLRLTVLAACGCPAC